MAFILKNRCFYIIVLVVYASLALGVMDSIEPSDSILDRSFHQIVIVEVVKLSSGPHTNRNPPSGKFRVLEVLRGHVRSKFVDVFWKARKTNKDYVEWTPDMPEKWRTQFYLRPLREEWYGRTFETPNLGEKLIVFARNGSSKNQVPPLLEVVRAVHYSPKNRDIIVRNMAPPDRNPRIQAFLLVLLVTSCPLVIIFNVIALVAKGGKRKNLLKSALVVSAFSLFLYMFYERGVRTGGIRIDLLVVYPALFINAVLFIIGFIFLVSWYRRCSLDPTS